VNLLSLISKPVHRGQCCLSLRGLPDETGPEMAGPAQTSR